MGFLFAPFLEFHNRLKVSSSHQYELLSIRLGNLHNKFTMHMAHATTRNCSLLLLTPIFCASRSAHPFSTYATFATTQQGLLTLIPIRSHIQSVGVLDDPRASLTTQLFRIEDSARCSASHIASKATCPMSHPNPYPFPLKTTSPLTLDALVTSIATT